MSSSITSPKLSLDELLSTAQDGVFAIDRNRQYVIFNPGCERITGYRAADLVGKPCQCSDTVGCSDPQGRSLSGVLCPASGLFEGTQSSARQRMEITRADQSRIFIETSYTAVRNQVGEVCYVLGIMRDASEMRARELDLLNEVSKLRTRVKQRLDSPQARDGIDSATAGLQAMGSALGAEERSSELRGINPPSAEQATPQSLELDPYLESVEKGAILRALAAADWQRNKAAELMRISRSRLYRRMEALGIDPREHP